MPGSRSLTQFRVRHIGHSLELAKMLGAHVKQTQTWRHGTNTWASSSFENDLATDGGMLFPEIKSIYSEHLLCSEITPDPSFGSIKRIKRVAGVAGVNL